MKKKCVYIYRYIYVANGLGVGWFIAITRALNARHLNACALARL